MFEGLQRKFAERKALAELSKNPVVDMGRNSIKHHWLEQPTIKQQHSKEFVANIANQLMERVVQVATAPNPLAANRQQLFELTIAASIYQVLILDPPPVEDVTGIRGRLGISGTLRARISELVELDPFLKDDFYGTPIEGDDPYYQLCLIRYRQCHAAMHVHAALRFVLDDYNRNMDLDWFKPFFFVQCATAEADYRMKLDLPAVLEPVEALEYLTLGTLITEGEKWPDLAWERKFGRKLPRLVSA